MKLPPCDEFIFDEVVTKNEYQLPGDMAGWRVLDVGGHAGCFAMACAQRGAEMVHSYEPCRDTFDMLTENAKAFSDDRYVRHNAAIVGRPGVHKALLYHWDKAAGHSLHRIRASHEVTECVHVDEALKRLGPVVDLVKIDAEDSEYEIVAGTVFPGVKRLAIEFHKQPEMAREALRRLETLGFKRTRLDVAYPQWGYFRLYAGER